MNLNLKKRSILRKSYQFGALTLLSRVLGIIRERLQVEFLGLGAVSDAFIIAFRIPSSLRKVFAEGALSAAFVPIFVKITKTEPRHVGSRLMTSAFLFFEGIVGLCVALAVWWPQFFIRLIASGFSPEQMAYATTYVRILFPFIFFISSNALLVGALQAVNHFFLPAATPVLLNIAYVGSLFLCLRFGFSVTFLCYGILLGGLLSFFAHIGVYLWYSFSFEWPDAQAWKYFKQVVRRFINCLFGVSVMELNLLIDGNIASFLAAKSVSLLYYGTRFMQIPLGVFVVGFSTVLLSHLSRVVLYAPRRLNFYILEAAKFITWIVTPFMLFFMATSHKLFSTLIMSKKISADNIHVAALILIIMSSGLIIFSINKILTNVFYSLGDTSSPAIAGACGTLANLVANIVALVFCGSSAIYGIAAATVCSGAIILLSLLFLLFTRHGYEFYGKRYFEFCVRYVVQLFGGVFIFYVLHTIAFTVIEQYARAWQMFFTNTWGYWLIALPLMGVLCWLLYVTRRVFGIKLYFLNR